MLNLLSMVAGLDQLMLACFPLSFKVISMMIGFCYLALQAMEAPGNLAVRTSKAVNNSIYHTT